VFKALLRCPAAVIEDCDEVLPSGRHCAATSACSGLRF